jgi:hypothetical protein
MSKEKENTLISKYTNKHNGMYAPYAFINPRDEVTSGQQIRHTSRETKGSF